MHVRWLAAAVVLLLGCGGGDGYKYVPVSGQITLGGKPVADARVSFAPVGSDNNRHPGVGSYGRTDADGRFSLKVVGTDQAGAAVGKHRVEVVASDEAAVDPNFPDAAPKARKPAAPPQTYSLEVEVPAGGLKDKVIELKPK